MGHSGVETRTCCDRQRILLIVDEDERRTCNDGTSRSIANVIREGLTTVGHEHQQRTSYVRRDAAVR